MKNHRNGLAILMVLLCAAVSATAQDAVKLSGFWIEPVTVADIRGGQVHYQTRAGLELSRPFETLEGLRLERYPALGLAQDAIESGDDQAAAALLRQAAERADEPWVKAYAGMMRVNTLARLDDADAAAGMYVDMVVSGVELTFIGQPPVDVVASADAAVRLRVSALAKTAAKTVGPERAALLEKLIDAAGSPPARIAAAEVPVAGAGGAGDTGGAGPVLSAGVPPGSIVNLYRAGQYDMALIAAEEALTRPGKTAAELYLKGMAQLALAEKTKDRAGYQSAGLSFMRVVTYFPRSAVSGPAWLEAGYVHQVIGRPDVASRLYARARPLIHKSEDPAYDARMTKLASELDAIRSGN